MPDRWLLDVNVPVDLVTTLGGYGIDADNAAARGWKELTNGRLLEAAANAGFTVIVTRDRRFGQATAKSLKQTPTIALVVVTLRQARIREFLLEFEAAWLNQPISPVAGRVIVWL
jgi:hypothetical protein